MLRRKRGMNCTPTTLTPGGAGGSCSVSSSAAAGGETKSLRLDDHSWVPWHELQPAWPNSVRPSLTCWRLGPPSFSLATGATGERTANCTHSFSASSAGTLPPFGGETVTCERFAFGLRNALIVHGAKFTAGLSPSSRPWLGSKALVIGGGSLHGCACARFPGPETLRMFASKSWT